jgi:hypothetical protein
VRTWVKAPLAALSIPAVLGLYLVVTSTVSLSSNLAILDAQRLAQFGVFALLLLTALIDPAVRTATLHEMARVPRTMRFGLVLFFACGIISSAVNAQFLSGLAYSLVDVALLGLVLCLLFVVAGCRVLAGTAFDRLVVSVLTLLGLAVGIQELTGVLAARAQGYEFSYDMALIHFAHPRSYNQLQSWTVPVIAVLPLVFPRQRLAALLCVAALGLHWYILLMTGARGSTAGLVLAFLVVFVLSPAARKPVLKWQSAGLILGLLIYTSIYLSSGSGVGPEIDTSRWTGKPAPGSVQQDPAPAPSDGAARKANQPNSAFFAESLGRPMLHTTGRTWLWKQSLEYAKENPVWGIGPMNFACLGPERRVGSPHNLAMQVVSEWGIPALGLLLGLGALLALQLYHFLRECRDREQSGAAVSALLACGVLAALMLCAVDGVFITPASQLSASLVAAGPFPPCATSGRQPREVCPLLADNRHRLRFVATPVWLARDSTHACLYGDAATSGLCDAAVVASRKSLWPSHLVKNPGRYPTAETMFA